MSGSKVHTFHIPVLGLSFSIDTPLRVARYGISSVVSLVDDVLVEQIRKQYSVDAGKEFEPIPKTAEDFRAKRITAYLDLLHEIVQRQVNTVKASAFESGGELAKYFEMLADQSPLKAAYRRMMHTHDQSEKQALQDELRRQVVAGDIDVNIMTKLDKQNTGPHGEPLGTEFSDAVASLRGFVKSKLESSVVFSAGLNPRLYTYLAKCREFLPDVGGRLKKKVILKVSDFRSAQVQGRFLAKKGVWISEFRIESGLNCGGHAFATDGSLLGPILEEFKKKRDTLVNELHEMWRAAVAELGVQVANEPLPVRVTVQGGIGTSEENAFLMNHYGVDGTGWGSPFLLVPEATNMDDATRAMLSRASNEDFYLSNASPLGVPFNNFRGSASEKKIRQRVDDGRPGSPCTKKFLVTNTEFTKEPICTASRQYQSLKLKQLEGAGLPEADFVRERDLLFEKSCLCEDLASSSYIAAGECGTKEPRTVAICPGPNLAYFSKISTLEEMVGHIYGRVELLNRTDRPNMFVNELRLYVEYFRAEVQKLRTSASAKQREYLATFRANLQAGVDYYHQLIPALMNETAEYRERMKQDLRELEAELLSITLPEPVLG
jgi:hypothetical protein